MSDSFQRHLDVLAHRAGTARAEVAAICEGLEPGQLLWRPGPGRWGVADCLEHLVAMGEGYHPRIRRALEEAVPAPEGGEYRPRLFGRLFLWGSGPRVRIPLPAPKVVAGGQASPDSPERFRKRQDELLELIRAAEGKDLNRTRVASPLSRFVSFTLGECLELLVGHQERHLNQARKVREHWAFPDREGAP